MRVTSLPPKMLIVVAVLAAWPASAQPLIDEENCADRIQNVMDQVGDTLDAPGYGPGRTVLRDLRNAALHLRTQEMGRACLQTVEAMEAALAAYREAGPVGGEMMPAPELGDIDRRAIPFGEAAIDTATIEGADVYNYGSDYLGEISGVVLDAGRPTHVLVGQGTFWDVGPDQVAIPAALLRWDPEWDAFFVPITSEAFQEAPAYTADAGAWNPEENDSYFEEIAE